MCLKEGILHINIQPSFENQNYCKLVKNKRNIQEINSVKIIDKSMTIDRLILFSRTKVGALVVYHMISCFPAISLRFLTSY